MELMLSGGSILTLWYIIMSYLVGEFLIELMIAEGSILTSRHTNVLLGW